MPEFRLRRGKDGPWCSRTIESFGFRECAAATRTPIGPEGRTCCITVSEVLADPKLEGHSVRRIVYTAEAISARVRQLGREITDYYREGDLLVLGLLKGSFIFVSDLVRNVERPLQVDFLVVSSYGSETVSSGNVRLVYDPETVLEGKHILLVEDIVDSGRTLSKVIEVLNERHPASIEICALLDKHISTYLKYPPKFIGFEAPHEFLVGYGLDHAENFRHLPYIASLQ